MAFLHVQPFDDAMEGFSMTSHSPDAFVAIDYEFRFLFVNRRAEQFYKKRRENLIGLQVEAVFPEQWNFGPFKTAMQNVRARKPLELNYRSPFANAWVQLVGRPFENYYTFTYRMIDPKEALRRELRSEVRKKHK